MAQSKLAGSRRPKAEKSTEPYTIEVSLGSVVERVADAAETDVFAQPVSEIRKMDGLSANAKRAGARLEKKMQGADGARSKRMESTDNQTGYTLFDVVLPPYNLDYLAALYEKSSPHAAAVKAKVNNIVGLGYDWVESDDTKEKIDNANGDEEKLKSIRRKLARMRKQMQEWLDSCNEEDDFLETMRKVWTDYETTGNGYLEIGRTTTGEIKYLGHIPSTTMRVRKNRDGFVQIIENKAVFFRNFGDLKTSDQVGNDPRPNEVIHFKKYTPTNGYYGVSDIHAAMNAIVGNEFSARFNLDYFENKAVPRYVIVTKGGTLSPSSEQKLIEFFQTTLKGKNHRTLYVPLPADEPDKKVSFEMQPVEAGTQDASFMNYDKSNLNSILMAHGVPAGKAFANTGNTSLANSRDQDKTFKEQVCRPDQKIVENKLHKIIKEKTNIFFLKLTELSLTDEDTQSKIDERYLRLGTVVPNEVRARKGLPGIKKGDEQIEMSPQMKAEQAAQAAQSRVRDQQRTANATDTRGEGRSTQGEGRTPGTE
jgi:PBSX family phage portal protein